jgi:hypothetical protein
MSEFRIDKSAGNPTIIQFTIPASTIGLHSRVLDWVCALCPNATVRQYYNPFEGVWMICVIQHY